MKNRYDKAEAQKYVDRYPDFPAEMGLRVYTSRLIGQEDDLVLHGGGNTSAKARMINIFGEEQDVIFVKGSGWDLGSIEPAGLPGLDLQQLKKLRVLSELSDEAMVNQFRTNLLDASSPNPSIETLVHAFLPHAFIDHTHADAIVTLTNQPNAEDLLQQALGDKIGILPFIMPGFPLAQAVIDLYEQQPDMECLILRNHGIFTFHDNAQTSYDLMIDYVSRAEEYIAGKLQAVSRPESAGWKSPDLNLVMPLLRGALSFVDDTGWQRTFHLHLRTGDAIMNAVNQPDAEKVLVSGVLTPDHVIRTKNYPLYLDFDTITGQQDMAAYIQSAVEQYQQNYIDYFDTQIRAKQIKRTRLDTMPRVMLVKGAGIITAGKTIKDAVICADICEHTLAAKMAAQAVGQYAELDPSFIFDMEYWSLEQVKLGRNSPASLEGRIALVTGGGGAIAVGIGRKLLEAGARVFMADIDADRLAAVYQKLTAEFGIMVQSLIMDVTDEASVQAGFTEIIQQAGGIDIVVPNAGIAHVANLEDLDHAMFHKVLDVNLSGVFTLIKTAIPVFKRQATGGQIIINSSKNVFAPGASFGAYSASKAGAHQLGKIAALELAEIGVQVNMINADAIFDDGAISSGLWDVIGPDRMKSRNLDPEGLKEYYRQRNLLKTTVLADHVGNGVVFFATGQTPTTGATLPVDGGIMAAFPR
jgi:rhamnose utilization protein RhaD (predicted bifunctional aldolase and dehydrogenase)/NAD(P)-dependent dehydrogenase (short-subunit alcohol dehydrogenase family)